MSNTLQYTLSLNDQLSTKLQKIGVTSLNALDKFTKLEIQSRQSSQLIKVFGLVADYECLVNLLHATQSRCFVGTEWSMRVKELEWIRKKEASV